MFPKVELNALGEPVVVAIVSYIHLAPYLGLLACLASSQKVGMVF